MLRKSPYLCWLLIALFFWAAAFYQDGQHKKQLRPATIAGGIQHDLSGRERNLNEFLADKGALTQVLNKAVSDTLFTSFRHQSFYLFAYRGGKLEFWNDDDLLAPYDASGDTLGRFTLINNNYCIRKVYRFDGDHLLIALLPIATSYPFKNQYLQTSFDAIEEVPDGIGFSQQPLPNTYAINSRCGRYWFSIRIPETPTSLIRPDNLTIGLAIAAIIFSAVWLQLLLLGLSGKRGWRAATWVTIGLLVLLRAVTYQGLPLGLGALELFSPAIYHYGSLIPSLGDLLISELCLLWLLIHLLAGTPYRHFFSRRVTTGFRVFAVMVCIFLLLFINTVIGTAVIHLVSGSQISFDVAHLHNINSYTIIALLCIALSIISATLTFRLANAQLRQLVFNGWLKQFLVTGAGLLGCICLAPHSLFWYSGLIWLTVYMIVLDQQKNTGFNIGLSLPAVLLSLFSCGIVGLNLHELVRQRDLYKDRVAYANHVLTQQDPLMEYSFKSIATRICQDEYVDRFFEAPTLQSRDAVARRLDAFYLDDLQSSYRPGLYFFDLKGHALFNEDTGSATGFYHLFNTGKPVADSNLVFTTGQGEHFYLARLRFARGLLFIRLPNKKTINQLIYPEFLKPATINPSGQEEHYAYALYAQGKLVTQTGSYVFPHSLETGFKTFPGIAYISENDELIYQEAPGNAVIVAGNRNNWLRAIVLLSYLFWVYLLVLFAWLLYSGLFHIALHEKPATFHITFRRRINLSMQSIVLVSFLIVGLVTIVFFTAYYRKSRRATVQEETRTITRFIRQSLATAGGLKSTEAMDSVAKTAEFHAAISGIATNQGADANLFSARGELLITTQEALYDQGLLARVMQPQAYHDLVQGAPVAQLEEYVGKFHYHSCYLPLKDDDDRILAYVSVPFFSSEKELWDEISYIIVTLLILYTLLFLLSSASAVVITSKFTDTVNLIMSRFSKLNLRENELIVWPYDDEIGLLVNEYNKMARKVEANAILLARSERETAWREMAKQVAHEIKNPLTPMKLNIQYLQRALKDKRTDVEALAERVSASLIEQIDNLSYIASEFSSFATMPEARGEVIDLKDFLGKALVLYEKEEGISITYTAPERNVIVMADKSQLLRVCTNLVQNAIQSIEPLNRAGAIQVVLTATANEALIAIKDNGSGISDETAARIFTPYFTTKSSGTGLGLAMTRKIIEFWKGEIWFESRVGKGTTFFVKLPLYQA